MKATPTAIDWHSDLPIFACESFLKAVGDEYGWIGGIDAAGTLRCILPYTVIRKANFRFVRFRIATIPLGDHLDENDEKAFLNSAMEHFRSIGADMVIPATNSAVFRTYPDGARIAPYGTYIIDLCQPEESLWSNLHPKHRNVIRNAAKKGVVVQSGLEYVDTAYELVRTTLGRSRMRFMRPAAFRGYVDSLGENVKLLVAYHEGSVQGCAVIPFSRHSAYYVYGGTIPKPLTGAMNLLHWEAMKQLRNLEVRQYDFVGVRISPEKGSKQEGLRTFKERFGGRLADGYMWKFPFHPLKYAVYSLVMRLQKGGDIVDAERNKRSHPKAAH